MKQDFRIPAVPRTEASDDAMPDPALAVGLTQRALTAADGAARIASLNHAGRVYWVKRPERPSRRMRLQKGDPRQSFERERATLHHLRRLGASVPPIVAEGADFFVLPDCGPALSQFITEGYTVEGQRIFRAAGRSLAQLHALGQRHGRPSLRDICWNGHAAVLLDFERGVPNVVSPRAQAIDVLILIHSIFTLDRMADGAARAVRAGYLADPAQNAAIWTRAQTLAHRLRWIAAITGPLRRREARANPPKQKREWAAIPATLAFFAGTDVAPAGPDNSPR